MRNFTCKADVNITKSATRLVKWIFRNVSLELPYPYNPFINRIGLNKVFCGRGLTFVKTHFTLPCFQVVVKLTHNTNLFYVRKKVTSINTSMNCLQTENGYKQGISAQNLRQHSYVRILEGL